MTDTNFWINNEITDFNESTLKKEFTDQEYNLIYEKLFRHFHGKSFYSRGKKYLLWTYENFTDFFGLPYTSSSAFAVLWNTNSECFILDNYNLEFFAIDEAGRIIAGASNENEHYRYFNLGQLDIEF